MLSACPLCDPWAFDADLERVPVVVPCLAHAGIVASWGICGQEPNYEETTFKLLVASVRAMEHRTAPVGAVAED